MSAHVSLLGTYWELFGSPILSFLGSPTTQMPRVLIHKFSRIISSAKKKKKLDQFSCSIKVKVGFACIGKIQILILLINGVRRFESAKISLILTMRVWISTAPSRENKVEKGLTIKQGKDILLWDLPMGNYTVNSRIREIF